MWLEWRDLFTSWFTGSKRGLRVLSFCPHFCPATGEKEKQIFGSNTEGFYRDGKITYPCFERKRQYLRVEWVSKSLEVWYGRNKYQIKIISKAFTNFKILLESPLFLKTSEFFDVYVLSRSSFISGPFTLYPVTLIPKLSRKNITRGHLWHPRASPTEWGLSKA